MNMGSVNFIQPVYCPTCGVVARVPVPQVGSVVRCSLCASQITVNAGEDVFVSYSSCDDELAQCIAAELHKRNIRFWLAPHLINHGEAFPDRIENALHQASVVIALVTQDAVESPWVGHELSIAISARKKVVPVLFDDVVLPSGWGLRTVESQHILTNRDSLSDALASLASEVAKQLGPQVARELRVPAARQIQRAITPVGIDRSLKLFVGPQQYTSEYRDKFFGRELELAELIRRLKDERIITVVAPSGAGKSSLLAAGLEPAIKGEGWQVISGARVGHPPDPNLRFPFSSVSNVFTFSAMRGVSEATEGIEEVRSGLTAGRSIAECLRRYPRQSNTRRLLILDQFEEIFTQYRHRHEHRVDFGTQLEQAQREDPDLTILIAMRQEYVVDLNHLMESVPKELRSSRFELRRLGNQTLERVISDIAAPQARFAKGVAKRIIDELNTIHVLTENGDVETKAGEYIELVHLQIVCQHLWETLRPGQVVIDHQDLDNAAEQSGQLNFDMFVRSALNQFYAKTVAAVAGNRGNTEPRVGDDIGQPQPADTVKAYPEELIRLGCRGFVTREHTRRQIHEEGGYVGRLPSWVVQQLADRYLLRLDTAGSVRYYELSHDLLAPIVANQSDPRAENLLYAAELLKKRLDGVLLSRNGSLTGWFEEADELLTQCEVYLDAPGYLLKDECEILLRASIKSGKELARWSQRVFEDAPDLYEVVLLDAIDADQPEIRKHVIWMLRDCQDPDVVPKLLELLVNDVSQPVRFEAALALLKIDDEQLFDELFRRSRNDPSNQQLSRAVAMLLALADELAESKFNTAFDALRGHGRWNIRIMAWGIRMREAVAILPTILLVTAVFAGGFAACYKWIPGNYNWGLVQASPGAFMGVFHGLIAGTIWGGGISAGVAIHRLVFFQARHRTGVLRPFGSIIAGGVAGILSSIVVVLVLTNTYELPSLERMGWIGSRVIETEIEGGSTKLEVFVPSRLETEFYADLFLHTRMGWAHLILGTFLGIGIAATTNSARSSPAWERFLDQQSAFVGLRQIALSAKQIFTLTLRHLWPVLITQLIGGLIVYNLVRPGLGAKGRNNSPLYGIIGDASTQVIGTLGAVVGLGVVTIIIRHGMVIKPRSKAR